MGASSAHSAAAGARILIAPRATNAGGDKTGSFIFQIPDMADPSASVLSMNMLS